MFTAASVMNKVWGWPGTSMTKTWLMRRPVRIPVSRFTTSDSSSSVCRLPFMSSSALPERTSSTAFSAAAWLCGTSTISTPPRSSEEDLATLFDFLLRADEDRLDETFLGRLQGPSERGLVTRMRNGGEQALAVFSPSRSSRSYFSCCRGASDLGHDAYLRNRGASPTTVRTRASQSGSPLAFLKAARRCVGSCVAALRRRRRVVRRDTGLCLNTFSISRRRALPTAEVSTPTTSINRPSALRHARGKLRVARQHGRHRL